MTIPQTPEAVAYKLMQDILTLEEKYIGASPKDIKRATRKDILDTYAECIKVVKGL